MTDSTTAPSTHPAAISPTAPDATTKPSINLSADSIFADGLGTAPTGLVDETDEIESVEELLPLSQRMSPVMLSAHASVDSKLGDALTTFTLAELQALKTQATLRERQLLTTSSGDELFTDIAVSSTAPNDATSTTDTRIPTADEEQPERSSPLPRKLSRLEYAQIRQDNVHLSNVVCIRATADLVSELRRPETAIDIPGRRQGETPLAAATAYVATALRVTYSTIDKRLTAANAMWPSMHYRRTKTVTPHLASQLQQGRLPFDSAVAAHQRLTSIRQAVRRAGGDEDTADDMVRHREREFVRHALRNDPHTFGRFAKTQSDAVTNELIGPAQTLTNEQIKHEKGIFYDAPIGDRLHRLSLVVDDAELLHFTAIREFATKLDSTISALRARAHDAIPDEPSNSEATRSPADPEAPLGDTDRLTSEDIDLGIGKLFDGQTRAERWLNTLLDFTSAGLMLHKTYDPHATLEEQQDRDTALERAAAHSETLSDILGMNPTSKKSAPTKPSKDTAAHTATPAAPPDDPLTAFIPPGFQLLRTNLDLIVEITLQDLVGTPSQTQSSSRRLDTKKNDSELLKIFEQLKGPAQRLSAPVGSPGNMKIDPSLARQQACHQRIVPMVLGSTSQPLDVGRAQRSFTPAMRRALHVRDRGCVVPGCPRPAPWCEPHHLEAWADGGSTSVSNGVLLCRQHHAAVHRGLLMIHMEKDGRPSCSLPPSQDPTQTRYRNVYWSA